ncbi:MAG: lamin tail domain-containing protein [Bacteroidia bacterium]|nr:lamin tail domain-containing protein [Bacteroidia bacterium]MCO5254605.1 lamin tail domain-containing protein [Bacteroidota bacterium]
MKHAGKIVWLLLLCSQGLTAQIDDKFDYDSLNQNPAWTGNTNDFIIVNHSLRSNLEQTNSNFYISRPTFFSDSTEWLITMELQLNTSSANYVDWFLMADSVDLLNTQNAYYVRIGNTADEVSLYKKIKGQTPQILINGTDGILNRSNNPLTIRVLRYPNGKWSMDINTQGLLEPLIHEGDTIDTELENLPFTGLLIRQSTASFFQKHFFHLYYMGKEIRDSIPPKLIAGQWIGDDSIHLIFDEKIDSASVFDLLNYNFSPSLSIASIDFSDTKTEIGLRFVSPLVSLTHYILNLSGIKDLEGNKMLDTSLSYFFLRPEPAQPFDLVINEIMATPTPSAGLPEYMYVEVYNRSDKVIELNGFSLSDKSITAQLKSFLLLPDSFIVLCPNNAVPALSAFGTCMGVSNFPTFNKTSDDVYLRSADGTLIHAVFYSDTWYKDAVKKNGGFSLEMIDMENPCTGYENWSASKHPNGGTPMTHNSVKSNNADQAPPILLNAYALAPDLIELRFNEYIDSLSGLDLDNYHFAEAELNQSIPLTISLNKIQLRLPKPMELNKVYTLTVKGLTDCSGNSMNETTIIIGLPDKPERGDLLINEILFNPPTGLTEFVEIYNYSKKILDLKDIRIGNLKDDGSLRDFVNPAASGYLIFPGEYLAFSTSGAGLCRYYDCKNPKGIFQINLLPSYPQKSGGVVLTDYAGVVIDSFLYNEKMHFQLITDRKGVSLERIEFARPTTDQGNWASATGSAGYATPGYKNSQAYTPTVQNQLVWLDSDVFSPDGDGIDDKLNIRFDLKNNNFVANVYIYSSSGVFVAQPIANLTLNSTGVVSWDGFYKNSSEHLPFGIYIVIFEAFNDKGEVVKKKFACTLVGKY